MVSGETPEGAYLPAKRSTLTRVPVNVSDTRDVRFDRVGFKPWFNVEVTHKATVSSVAGSAAHRVALHQTSKCRQGISYDLLIACQRRENSRLSS
jgi:hypothetical protein